MAPVRYPINSCGRCEDVWICEEHPDQPKGHGGCDWPGMPCQNPDCSYSIKRTGLVCPQCKQSMGVIEHQTDRLIRFRCGACRFVWRAEATAQH